MSESKKRVLIFGATGTVGAGALLECLDHPEVGEVLCVLRRPTGRSHEKLKELIHEDFLDFSPLAQEFNGVDACLWAIGVPSPGRTEAEYKKITHDYALAAAELLVKQSPGCCFVFISGAGAGVDSRIMWARVKGMAERAILGLGFARALVFRPGGIVTSRGIQHNVLAYRLGNLLAPLGRPFGMTTSTVEIGRAFIAAALGRAVEGDKTTLDSRDINSLALDL